MQSISASNNPISKEFELEQSIAEAWDGNVELRSKELFNATDDCYINIIQPWVLSKINEYTDSNDFLLDIGCGCGYLTNQIYLNGRTQIIGIDISKKSPIFAIGLQRQFHILTKIKEAFCLSLIEKT